MVMSKTFQLEPEVSREHFDKVFDAHWHNGFIIRHLIYKQSKGENSISVLDKSPPMKKPGKKPSSLVKTKPKGSSNSKLLQRLHDSDDDDSD